MNVVPDFLSETEEQQIIQSLPEPIYSGSRSAVWRYGSNVYGNGIVDPTIPDWLLTPALKLVVEGYLPDVPKYVTVNKYEVGDFIAPHIDHRKSGEVITILSLLSDTTMILERREKKEILLPARSLLQLRGEFRWRWKHSIPPVKALRYSIVYRD